jgi:hypothetical protein
LPAWSGNLPADRQRRAAFAQQGQVESTAGCLGGFGRLHRSAHAVKARR